MKSYHKNSSPGRTLQQLIQYSYIIIFISHIYNLTIRTIILYKKKTYFILSIKKYFLTFNIFNTSKLNTLKFKRGGR